MIILVMVTVDMYTQTKHQDFNAGFHIRYLGKMLQHHLLLSFTKRRGRKKLPLRVNFLQVFTGDGRLEYHLTSSCLQCWDKTKGILLKEPVRFIFQIDVDGVMSERQKQVLQISSESAEYGNFIFQY